MMARIGGDYKAKFPTLDWDLHKYTNVHTYIHMHVYTIQNLQLHDPFKSNIARVPVDFNNVSCVHYFMSKFKQAEHMIRNRGI